jgi:radical SAM-linked protein
MRFLSHLDLVRLFHRATRRAGLPVEVTKGFSPRLKVNILRALKLGLESESEEVVFYLEKDMTPQKMAEAINKKLPEGIKVLRAEEMM